MYSKRGFTLIELLVVIAIIGILSVMVVTQLGSARVKARVSTAKSDVTEAGKAVEVFKNDDGAGDQVISVKTTNTIETLATAADGTVSGSIGTLFTGTLNTNTDPTYSVKLSKTPGAAYTYSYTAPNPTVNNTRNLVTTNATSCYLVYVNGLKAGGSGEKYDYFYVYNGSTGSVDTNAPTCATH